jgi:hypothetical protein
MSRKGRRAKSKKRTSDAPKAGLEGGLSVEAFVDAEGEEAAVSSEPVFAEPEPVAQPAQAVEPSPAPIATADDKTPEAVTTSQLSEEEGGKTPGPPASTPPAELDHHFFSARPVHVELHPEPERTDPRIAHRHSAFAMERRKHFAKYVKIAVGVAAVVCLAAVGKVMLVHDAPGTAAYAEERPTQTATATAAANPPPPAPAVSEAPSAATAQAAEPAPSPHASQEPAAPAESASAAAAAASAAPSAAPSASAATEPVPSAAASASDEEPARDPKEALKAKNTARGALERGALAAAIEAGEKSVSLDPTDAEAWLLLGAAYQEKGDMKDARRCYKSCLSEGKRGSKADCAAMLR